MKVYINGELYEPSNDYIVLVFESDLDRLSVADHLASMEAKDGVRLYAQFPESFTRKQRINVFRNILTLPELIDAPEKTYNKNNPITPAEVCDARNDE
jgi:hypothetical protein